MSGRRKGKQWKGQEDWGWFRMGKQVTVKEMVRKYLKENDFDGLFHEEFGCACILECLMHECGDMFGECVAGYAKDKGKEILVAWGECDVCVSGDKKGRKKGG